jgi:hypothetical protein
MSTCLVTLCLQLFVQQFRLSDVKKKCIYGKYQREKEISLSRFSDDFILIFFVQPNDCKKLFCVFIFVSYFLVQEKCSYDDTLSNDFLRNRASLFPLAISDRVIIKVYFF